MGARGVTSSQWFRRVERKDRYAMWKFDTAQLKVRVVENTTDTILEGAVSFTEENFIPAISILNYSTTQLGVKRRDGDHSKLYHTNY